MSATLYLIISLIISFLVGVLFSRKANQKDAEVLDLTNKIANKKKDEAAAQAKADDAVKEYQDALKKYDPDFHSDDTGDGKPSA